MRNFWTILYFHVMLVNVTDSNLFLSCLMMKRIRRYLSVRQIFFFQFFPSFLRNGSMQVCPFWLLNLFALTLNTRLLLPDMFCSFICIISKWKTLDFTTCYIGGTFTEKVGVWINSRSQARIIEKYSEMSYSSSYCIRPSIWLY